MGGREAAPTSLPCLNRNNSIEAAPEKEISDEAKRLGCKLTSAHRKTAYALKMNVAFLAEKYGIEPLGFLTLTFPDHVTDAKEASRRFNSLDTDAMRKRYVEKITVVERHKSGRIHFHCLVVLPHDIRTGVDFAKLEAVINSKGRTTHQDWVNAGVGAHLFAEWAFWRKTAGKFGFGRTELLPVKSNAEAISCYVGKYIAKHIDSRKEVDKGVRLVRYSRGAGRVCAKFAWNSPGAQNFRRKMSWLCAALGCTTRNYRAFFRQHFGEKWMWKIVTPLFQVRFRWYPSHRQFLSDWPEYTTPGNNPIFFHTRWVFEGMPEDSNAEVEILDDSQGKDGAWLDAELRQAACLDMIRESVLESEERAMEGVRRSMSVPRFSEFVSSMTSWVQMSCPDESMA